MPSKIIELNCSVCNIRFNRKLAEYNRDQKRNKNKQIFCSNSCSAKYYNKKNPRYSKGIQPQHLRGLKRVKDELSDFRVFLRIIKQREVIKSKNKVNITLEDLKEIWNKQDGFCPYTKQKLFLIRNHEPYQASLDRIDSSRGYEKDNIEFISLIAQYAKNTWNKEDVIDFCKKVASVS